MPDDAAIALVELLRLAQNIVSGSASARNADGTATVTSTDRSKSVRALVSEDWVAGPAIAFYDQSNQQWYGVSGVQQGLVEERTILSERHVPVESGKDLAAVLYSVLNGDLREFWVKTKGADRLVATDSKKIIPVSYLHFAGNVGSSSATATITFSSVGTTTILPSSVSFSSSVTNGGTYSNASVVVIGDDPVTALVSASVTTSGAPIGGASGNIEVRVGFAGDRRDDPLLNPGWGWGFGVNCQSGSVPGTTEPSTQSKEVEVEIYRFISPYFASLNGKYAFIRKTAAFIGSPLPTLGIGTYVARADGELGASVQSANSSNFLEINAISLNIFPTDGRGFAQLRSSSLLILFNSATPEDYVYVFRLVGIMSSSFEPSTGINNALVSVAPLFTTSPSGTFTTGIFYWVYGGRLENGDIAYGAYGSGSDLLPVYAEGDEIPANTDDWRSPLVSFTPDLASIDPCLEQFIYNPQALLLNGKVYTIDLAQAIDGDTLRSLLQATPSVVNAVLSTRTAVVNAEACALGGEKAGKVKVPGPGRGLVESIAFIPQR